MAVIKRSIATGFDGGDLYAILTGIAADLAALKAAYDAHTHGGVTTGAGSTAAGPTAAAMSTNVHKTE